MKRLKKINKRICAAVMIIAMGLSMISGTRVLAAEEMNTDTKREDESEIITQPEETEVTNPETETKEETINENIDKNISNDDKIKSEIEKNFVKEVNSNYSSLIQNMVDTSKDSMKNIYDNMNFLFKINEDSRFLIDYTNKLLDIKNINQDSIYFKISEFIE